MNPLFALTLAQAAALGQGAEYPCPGCGTPLRIDEACVVCAMRRIAEESGSRKPGFRRYAPPPDEIVADLRAQLDTFTANLEQTSRAPARARASRTADERAYEKRLARQRASAKRAKEARKKQRGR